MMQSTMQDFPLNDRHDLPPRRARCTATARSSPSRVTTAAARPSPRSRNGPSGSRSRSRGLGVEPGDRVGTFMWNTQEHLEAYLAVPRMGAVLHTLNIRLFPEQLAYVVNHAEDRVDHRRRRRSSPMLAKVAAELETVERYVVVGDGDVSALEEAARDVDEFVRYDDLLAAEIPATSTGPRSTNGRRRRCVTRAARPATRRASSTRTARRSCTRSAVPDRLGHAVHVERPRPADRADVPRQRVGRCPYAAWMGGADLADAGPVPAGRAARADSSHEERPTFAGAVPTIWADILRYGEEHDDRPLVARSGSSAAARRCRAR